MKSFIQRTPSNDAPNIFAAHGKLQIAIEI